MKKTIKISLNNDEQIVLIRLIEKKLESCGYILNKNPKDVNNLLDKMKIYENLLNKIDPE